MKKTKGFVFFVVAVLIIGLAATSFFGVSSWYGDVKRTTIKGIDGSSAGRDLGQSVQTVLTPQAGVEVTDEMLDEAAEIITQRLLIDRDTASSVRVDYANQAITVNFPLKSGEYKYDITSVLALMIARGDLCIRRGNTYDTNNNPAGEVLLKSEEVSEAYAYVNSNGYPCVMLVLTKAAKSSFAATTKALIGEMLSFWMDDALLSSSYISESITSGTIEITAAEFTTHDVVNLANILSSGQLPFAMNSDSATIVGPTLGEDYTGILALGGGIALLLVLVLFLIFYRMSGAAASLGVLFTLSVLAMYSSGWLSSFNPRILTLAGVLAAVLAAVFVTDFGVLSCRAIRGGLYAGRSLDACVSTGYTAARPAVIDGAVLLFIASVLLMGGYGLQGLFPYAVIQPISTWTGLAGGDALYCMSQLMMLASIAVLGSALLSWIAAASAAKMKALRKNGFWFGGAK